MLHGWTRYFKMLLVFVKFNSIRHLPHHEYHWCATSVAFSREQLQATYLSNQMNFKGLPKDKTTVIEDRISVILFSSLVW